MPGEWTDAECRGRRMTGRPRARCLGGSVACRARRTAAGDRQVPDVDAEPAGRLELARRGPPSPPGSISHEPPQRTHWRWACSATAGRGTPRGRRRRGCDGGSRAPRGPRASGRRSTASSRARAPGSARRSRCPVTCPLRAAEDVEDQLALRRPAQAAGPELGADVRPRIVAGFDRRAVGPMRRPSFEVVRRPLRGEDRDPLVGPGRPAPVTVVDAGQREEHGRLEQHDRRARRDVQPVARRTSRRARPARRSRSR